MKKSFILLVSVLCLFACKKEEVTSLAPTKELTSVLSLISKKAIKEHKIMKFVLLVDKQNNTFGFEKLEKFDTDAYKLVSEEPVKEGNSKRVIAVKYQIECKDEYKVIRKNICYSEKCVAHYIKNCAEYNIKENIAKITVVIAS